MIRVDRSKVSPTEARHLEAQRIYSLDRRALNREFGDCVNENKMGTHGPATHGVRCAMCHEKRRAARRVPQ
jgi:hypothetical protein